MFPILQLLRVIHENLILEPVDAVVVKALAKKATDSMNTARQNSGESVLHLKISSILFD
jgi:hypothetical protein